MFSFTVRSHAMDLSVGILEHAKAIDYYHTIRAVFKKRKITNGLPISTNVTIELALKELLVTTLMKLPGRFITEEKKLADLKTTKPEDFELFFT